MADSPQGQALGKYHIVDVLGKGGFATVYRALDTTLEREIALKVLDPLLMRDETWVTRFHREARAVARLRHPQIVTIHEIGEADGRLYIAMELVEGPTLKELIAERGCLSWDEALGILDDVADALDYAHGEGILHRDLKPANILIDRRHGAVLTDFGFARLVGESSVSVSVSGGVVGTPAYIGPEVWDGEEASAQTDLYALGCIATEMLTGEVLFGGNTPSVVMRKHLLDGPQFPATWPVGVPGGVAEVLKKALAKEPARRFRSMAAFTDTLQARGPAATPGPQGTPKPVQRGPVTPPRGTRPELEADQAHGNVEVERPPSRVPLIPLLAGLACVLVLAFLALVIGPRLVELTPAAMPTRTPETPVALVAPTDTVPVAETPPIGQTVTLAPTYVVPPTRVVSATATLRATEARRTEGTTSTLEPTSTSVPTSTSTSTPMPATSTSAPKATRTPTPVPEPTWTCFPVESDADIHAEIAYPAKGSTVANGRYVEIIGSAAGSSFSRYTTRVFLDSCPERQDRYGNSARGCFFSLGDIENGHPVICDVLRVLDTSEWPEPGQGTYEVRVSLYAIKADANYATAWHSFYLER